MMMNATVLFPWWGCNETKPKSKCVQYREQSSDTQLYSIESLEFRRKLWSDIWWTDPCKSADKLPRNHEQVYQRRRRGLLERLTSVRSKTKTTQLFQNRMNFNEICQRADNVFHLVFILLLGTFIDWIQNVFDVFSHWNGEQVGTNTERDHWSDQEWIVCNQCILQNDGDTISNQVFRIEGEPISRKDQKDKPNRRSIELKTIGVWLSETYHIGMGSLSASRSMPVVKYMNMLMANLGNIQHTGVTFMTKK